MAPRKKKATAPTLAFTDPVTGVEIPKNNAPKGEFYRRVEALKVNEMIEVTGIDLAGARKEVRKVLKDIPTRAYEVRTMNADDPAAAIGVWRVKGKAAPKSEPAPEQQPDI